VAAFYADENFPIPTVEALRQLGHDVLTATLPLMGRAARKILRETKGAVQSDLLIVLQALSWRRYRSVASVARG
jgi:hypothetical protein